MDAEDGTEKRTVRLIPEVGQDIQEDGLELDPESAQNLSDVLFNVSMALEMHSDKEATKGVRKNVRKVLRILLPKDHHKNTLVCPLPEESGD